jgi:UDP-glucose 4-epimerase
VRVLITGAAGFVGSHVTELFSQHGYPVLAVDDLSSGQRENLPPQVPLEITRASEFARSREAERFEATVILHLAASIDATKSVVDPEGDCRNNLFETLAVIDLALRTGVDRLLFASSAAVYGEAARLPAQEQDPTLPLNPYGASKLAAEHYLRACLANRKTSYACLRLANVYGPRQGTTGEGGVVARFAERMLARAPCTIFGDGLQTRDFVYVCDVAQAFFRAAHHDISGVWNVGTGKETSILQLHKLLAARARNTLPPRFEPPRFGEPRRSALNFSKLEADLGWRPQESLASGLSKTLAWMKSRPQPKVTSIRKGTHS